MLGVLVQPKEEEAAIGKERRQKVPPALVEAQMGLKDLVLFQVKLPPRGSTLKELCAPSLLLPECLSRITGQAERRHCCGEL